jgi:exonuclease SbcD
VGGSGAVDPRAFAAFHYTALGHLHRPQSVGRETVRYSGSPLKYSLSEVDHAKSVSIVEIDARGACRIETVPLEPLRDVRRIEGRLADLLAAAPDDKARDDFVFVVLTDTEALLNPLARLREHYPRCVELNRAAYLGTADATRARQQDLRRRSDADLFAGFVHEVTGKPLNEGEAAAFQDVVDALAREKREADS